MPLVILALKPKESVTAAHFADINKFLDDEFIPAFEGVDAVTSMRRSQGGDGRIHALLEMDSFAAWDRILADAGAGAAGGASTDRFVLDHTEVLYDRPAVEAFVSQ